MRVLPGLTAATLIVFLNVNVPVQAQVPAPDFQSTVHVFPQFVDGYSGDRTYTSTLQISATAFSATTGCTLGLLSMPATTLADARGIGETNTVFNFLLGASGWQILRSQGGQTLRSGSAVLQCNQPVTAHLIYSQSNAGIVTSEATVWAAPPGRLVQILADQRRNARLALAIANLFSVVGSYKVSVIDIDGRLLSVSYMQIAPGQAFTGFLDEFAAVPKDYRGPVLIESIGGTDIYASGLRFTGDSFTAIPTMVRR